MPSENLPLRASASAVPIRLETPLRFLRGVGPGRAEKLAGAGLRTVEDLLLTVPLRYEDRRRVARVAEIQGPGLWTVAGRIEDLRAIRTRRRGLVSSAAGWSTTPALCRSPGSTSHTC